MKYSPKKEPHSIEPPDLTPDLKEILGQPMLNNTNTKPLAKSKMWDTL